MGNAKSGENTITMMELGLSFLFNHLLGFYFNYKSFTISSHFIIIFLRYFTILSKNVLAMHFFKQFLYKQTEVT